uniref:Uncharacterized protein n=1 Tax=Caenorhabditis japonica TaxID=281687 RepID=A0A8R1I8N2_CAEJA
MVVAHIVNDNLHCARRLVGDYSRFLVLSLRKLDRSHQF